MPDVQSRSGVIGMSAGCLCRRFGVGRGRIWLESLAEPLESHEYRVDVGFGVALILFYCVLRAAEIEHLKRIPVHTRIAHSAFWMVEVIGVFLVFVGSLRAAAARCVRMVSSGRSSS
jgi:hypothetical protein